MKIKWRERRVSYGYRTHIIKYRSEAPIAGRSLDQQGFWSTTKLGERLWRESSYYKRVSG